MKKFTTLFAISLLLCNFTTGAATNLLSGWDANGATGSGTKPTDYNWASTSTETQTWSDARGGSGCRYADYSYNHGTSESNTYKFNGVPYENRILWLRWGDAGFTRNSYYTYKVEGLTAGKIYTFKWKYAWHNNDDYAPTITTSFVKDIDGVTGSIASKSFTASSTKFELREGAYSFKVKETEPYYLSITANTGALIGICDLELIEVSPEEAITNLDVSEKAFLFIDGLIEEKTFTVSGLILEDINLTKPEGITLSQETIAVADLDDGKTVDVTATYTGSENIDNGSIQLSNSSLSQQIAVNAVKLTGDNLIEFWDGSNGKGDFFTGTGSEANTFGWSGTDVSSWIVANSTTPGIRYFDKIAGASDYKNQDGSEWTGRVLYVRWDGTGGQPTTIYGYPVNLESGKTYKFTGKYVWNSVDTGKGASTFKIGINEKADTTGIFLAQKSYAVTDADDSRLKVNAASFTFSPEESGRYYLTITNDKKIVGALAELKIEEVQANEPELEVSTNALTFDGANLTRTFVVTGSNLAETVNLTAPEGITLDKTILTIEEVQANDGATVTATFDNITTIENSNIEVKSGDEIKTIQVTATPAGSGLNDPSTITTPYITVSNNSIEIEFNLLQNGNVEFSVYNTQGALIAHEVENCYMGKNQKTIKMALTPGIYIVKLTDAQGNSTSQKIVK